MTRRLPTCISAALMISAILLPAASAQGTHLWTVSRLDEMEHGTTEAVAIRSDGRLETGPSASLLATSTQNYAWAVAAGPQGEAYLGLGGSSQSSATVLRISADGKSTKLWSGTELAVQALRVAADGTLFFATSPDGKLYRIAPNGTSGASTPTVLFDPAVTAEKPKYLWDLALIGSSVYIATGAPAAVYRVEADAPATPTAPSLVFKTADQHIRCLALGPDGQLWAGSDGSGVIYRLDTGKPGAKPFAAYAAPRREITSLAVDPAGNVFAAGVGARGAVNLPPLPVTGALGVSVTFLLPTSASAAGTNTLVPEGSEIYRITPDGAPSRLATLKDEVVYGLALREGALIAASGNRGRLYRIDTSNPGEALVTDLVHVEAAQATALAKARDGSLLVATGNGGKLFRIAPGTSPKGTYTSEIFDARQFTHFGRTEVRADSHGYKLYLRTGNVPSPLEGWSDWQPIAPDGTAPHLPDARFAQWKAVLATGGTLDGVAVNYLPRNLAPVVDEVLVQPGARVTSNPAAAQNQTIQIQYPAPTPTPASDSLTTPLAAQKDKTAVTTRWSAHDDNGDDLNFSVLVRGDGESNWHLLKDKITDHYLSFDSALLPDGNYRLKVVASDSPDHTGPDTLTSERISEPFILDSTPPVPGPLTTILAANNIHATFEAHDALSPIAHAEFSIDAGDWQYLEPVGQISDALTERYDFTAPLTPAQQKTSEHVLAIRVYDRYENSVTVKAVVKP